MSSRDLIAGSSIRLKRLTKAFLFGTTHSVVRWIPTFVGMTTEEVVSTRKTWAEQIQTSKINQITLGLSLVLASASGAFAQTAEPEACAIDSNIIDRGEKKQFLICGTNLNGSEVEGLKESEFSIHYAQRVPRCAPDRAEPGLLLWVKASDSAVSTTIQAPSKPETTCGPFEITVPDRVNFGQTELEPVFDGDHRIYRLRMTAPAGVDVSGACEGEVTFIVPESTPASWPRLSLLTQDEGDTYVPGQSLTTCTTDEIDLLVTVQGHELTPAKVILPITTTTGGAREGIAYAKLPEPAWLNDMSDADAKFVEINGYNTRYWEMGEGEDALILVHGGQPDPVSGGGQMWKQSFRALSQDFRVLAFDRIGQGLTDNPETDEDYLQYFDLLPAQLSGFIDALNLKRVHLVGYSQGGWPVTRVALDRPDIVKCLVNMDTVMAPFDGRSDVGRTAISRFAYLATSIVPPSGPTLEAMYRASEHSAHTRNYISWKRAAQDLVLAKNPKHIEAKMGIMKARMFPSNPAFVNLRKTALEEIDAGKLKVPSLMLWGRNDLEAPLELGLQLYERFSAGTEISELHVINNAGHAIPYEQPEAVNKAILGFCGQFRAP